MLTKRSTLELDRLVWQKALHRAIQKNRDKQVQKNIPN